MKALIPALALLGLLAACDRSTEKIGNTVSAQGDDVIDAVNTAAAKITDTVVDAIDRPSDPWLGKWTGVEGLALIISEGDKPGAYNLHVRLMDTVNDYAGTEEGNSIRFTRDGKPERLRHTDGAATGLKWLAGKEDCLTIKPGEGFCRD